jgi:hypothetical protein
MQVWKKKSQKKKGGQEKAVARVTEISNTPSYKHFKKTNQKWAYRT